MSRTGQWLSFLLARAAGRPNSAVIDEPDLVRRRQLKKIGVILVSLVAAGALVTAAFKIFAGDKGAKKDAHRPQVKLLQDKVAMEIKQSEDLGQLKYLQDENKALRDDILNLKGEVTRKSSGTSRSETGSRPNGPAGKQRLFIPPEPPSGPGLTAPVPQFDAPHAGVEENTGHMPLRLPFMPV